MLPLKLLRNLVSGDDVTNNPLFLRIHHDSSSSDLDDNPILSQPRNRIPLLFFTPSQELVKNTNRLCAIARAIGMDLYPNPSLSHIIFSWPSPPSSSSSSSSSSLQDDTVPLPFPSFATASLSHLRLFAALSKGFFKLAFCCIPLERIESLSNNNWHCTSLSLFSTNTGERIDSMDGVSRALLGKGWTLFMINNGDRDSIFLYRKLDVSRISNGNADLNLREWSRVRELRLPPLDFRNVPLRILQYILLMTDDIFYLA